MGISERRGPAGYEDHSSRAMIVTGGIETKGYHVSCPSDTKTIGADQDIGIGTPHKDE
jgi:hypothetical protein